MFEQFKDLGQKCVSKLKRLEGDELEAELRELMKIAGDPSESMGFLGSRRLRAGFLVIEHSVSLPRDKRTQLITELEALVPEDSRSQNFKIALARWHNAEHRIDLKGQLEILADQTVPQLRQEEVLRSVLQAEIELGENAVELIANWCPKHRPSGETLLAVLDRIYAKNANNWYVDLWEEHLQRLFSDWHSWFSWHFQTMLYGNRFSDANQQDFFSFLSCQLENQEPYTQMQTLFFVYEHVLYAPLSTEVQRWYVSNLKYYATKWGHLGFAKRLEAVHGLEIFNNDEYLPTVIVDETQAKDEVKQLLVMPVDYYEDKGDSICMAAAIVLQYQLDTMYAEVWHHLIVNRCGFYKTLPVASVFAAKLGRQDWLEEVLQRCLRPESNHPKAKPIWLHYSAAWSAMRILVRHLDFSKLQSFKKFKSLEEAEACVSMVYDTPCPSDPIVFQ